MIALAPPDWALTLAYWLHMLATVAWIGGLVTLSILVLPAARQTLDARAYAELLARLRRRLDPLGWLSLLVLAGTGLFQMSASPNYQGFLAFSNRWAVAILVKHIVFLGIIAISAYLTWGLIPRLGRAALLLARGQAAASLPDLQRQETLLMRVNLVLGILVLALTAIARVS
ncbi:MAG TPA: CopD family protein [Anaerolineales bacterium]|nr:CopD family protein [Anaerolineales bacterium]